MPSAFHDQLSGDDLHDNKIYPATGTPLPSWAPLDARYVNAAGDTLTGPLALAGNPTSALHAAPKQYIDAQVLAHHASVVIGASGSAGNNYTCDGVADDVELQAAVNALSAAGGGVIFLRNGDYFVRDEMLTWKSNVYLVGESRDKCRIFITDHAGNTQVGIQAVGTSGSHLVNIGFSNLTISNTIRYPLGSYVPTNDFAINADWVDNLTIDNVRTEMFMIAFRIGNATDVKIDRSVDFTGFNDGTDIVGHYGGTQDLVQIRGVTGFRITNNTIYGVDTGFRCQGVRRGVFMGNEIRNSSIEIGNGEGFGYSEDVLIIGNEFYNGNVTMKCFQSGAGNVKVINGYDIAVDGVSVIGNHFYLPDYQFKDAIVATTDTNIGGMANLLIANNDIKFAGNPNGRGMTLMVSTTPTICNGQLLYCEIAGNVIRDTPAGGIAVGNIVKSQIHHNKIINFNVANIGVSWAKAGISIQGRASYPSSEVEIEHNIIDGNGNTGAIGIRIEDPAYISNLDLTSNRLLNCPTPVSLASTLPTGKVRDNIGFATEGSGTATIPSGSTSVTVTHGLAMTPALKDITVTPTNGMGNAAKYWASNPTATQFTINVNADPGATTATFAWKVALS